VAAAAASLGYVPHLGARALAKRSSRTIGLLVPSTSDAFWSEVTAGLDERAVRAGFSVLLATSHGDAGRERAMLELFLGKRVDGIVIGSAAGEPAAWFSRGLPPAPIVLVSWEMPLPARDLEEAVHGPVRETIDRLEERGRGVLRHVRVDDVAGGVALASHLVGLGHRRIAFAGAAPVGPALLRLLGVRLVLEQTGFDLALIVPCAHTLEGGRAAGNRILAARPRPSAVIAFDDDVAVGIQRAVHAAGMRVPADLSIAGFDDIPVAAFIEPPLTTYAQPAAALGELAMDVVLQEREGDSATLETTLQGRLIVRGSTGAPPAA
jgi:LacI family transcriptional regulator